MLTSIPDENRLRELKAETAKLATPWVSEIVLQTNQYVSMKLWYEATLGRDFFYETRRGPVAEPKPRKPGDKQVFAKDVRACFMRLPSVEPYGIILALFELHGLRTEPGEDPGLNHMQLKHADVEALVRRIEALRDAGLHPHRSANHGPGTSFYFRDPDANILEFCIDNFATPAELDEFVRSETFRKNPSGIDLDRDDFIRRFRAGVPVKQLLAI